MLLQATDACHGWCRAASSGTPLPPAERPGSVFPDELYQAPKSRPLCSHCRWGNRVKSPHWTGKSGASMKHDTKVEEDRTVRPLAHTDFPRSASNRLCVSAHWENLAEIISPNRGMHHGLHRCHCNASQRGSGPPSGRGRRRVFAHGRCHLPEGADYADFSDVGREKADAPLVRPMNDTGVFGAKTQGGMIR